MKELIEKSGLTLKEFSELYEIPYNTVRQWYNEERQAPNYIKKLIEENRSLKAKGKQLNIEENIHLAAETKGPNGLAIKRFFPNERKREEWIESYEKAGCSCKKINLIEV